MTLAPEKVFRVLTAVDFGVFSDDEKWIVNESMKITQVLLVRAEKQTE